MGLSLTAAAALAVAVAWWARPVAAQDRGPPARLMLAKSPMPDGATAPVLPPKSPRTPVVGCLIGPERVADIGSPVTAVVASVKVERGDVVRKGQPLVVLDGSVEHAGVQAAQARAAIDADIHAAEATLALMQQKHRRMQGLVGEGFVAPQAAEQAQAERDVAEQKLAQARAQRTVQQRDLGVARAHLGQRTLRSPFAGVVAERFVNDGERAEEKPLLRVAMLDPLRVELVVPASRWGTIGKGDKLPIVPELPGAGAMLAKVTHVDRMIDAASNTFRVRLALANPGHKLPAGARCKLDAPAAPDASPPAANAAPAQPMPTGTGRPRGVGNRHPRLKFAV